MKKSDTPYMSNKDRDLWKAIEKLQATTDNLFREVDKISREIIKLEKKKK